MKAKNVEFAKDNDAIAFAAVCTIGSQVINQLTSFCTQINSTSYEFHSTASIDAQR